MKRTFFVVVLLLVGGFFLGRWLLADPGYVLLIRDGLRVEASLGFVLLLLILAAPLWSIITLLGVSLFRLAGLGRASRWRELIARRRLRAGFFALVDGDWARAGRLFAGASASQTWAVPARAGEALAAAAQGNHERVTEVLKLAAQQQRGQPMADLLAARLLLEEGATRQARVRLEGLSGRVERNPHRLRLLAEVLEREQDWPALVELLPMLKLSITDQNAFAVLEQRAWAGLLNAVAQAPGEPEKRLAELRRTWKEMPATLHGKTSIRAQYAAALVANGDGAAAFSLVRKEIEQNWDDRLIAVLEGIANVPAEKLLQQLEQWLEVRPGSIALLICAGRTAMKAKLWGKARSFFDGAARAGSVTALAELARLHSSLGDTDRALAALERRMMLLDEALPVLPLPSPRRREES
ncbi:heme biosynthesis protein HemY [Alcanivorax sp. 1008]|uniref:heme biosynthesis protein HemY n=1 Tax=Alcanivorax sp. 1008 TaxID=2816853 RepID=UPI001DD37E55|nr:heme biosynthesis HemY N-terminal domain-containing protein [Alcanivorax sp. 1008]MCC1497412.1 heme biosynthesis protein HemY [Alcanivorax sp. 1008]